MKFEFLEGDEEGYVRLTPETLLEALKVGKMSEKIPGTTRFGENPEFEFYITDILEIP